MNIAENGGAQHAAVQAAGDCGDPGQYSLTQCRCVVVVSMVMGSTEWANCGQQQLVYVVIFHI